MGHPAELSQNIVQMATFQETEFEAIVTVNVTLLLVLTTLFIGISNSLPKTAYIKVIDIWLITNLVSNSTAMSRFRNIS